MKVVLKKIKVQPAGSSTQEGGGGSAKEKKRKRRKRNKSKNGGGNGQGPAPKCKWCHKKHHSRCTTLDDPDHENYRADKKSGGGNKNNYRKTGVSKQKFEQI